MRIKRSAAGGSGAPTDADYLVGTANAGLSAEIVVGTSPGGELGGTWASPTVDATHSGSTHHAQSHADTDHTDPPILKALIDALGDLIYGSAADTPARLAGNITTTRKFLRQTGDGAASAAPAWDTIADADVPATHSGTAHHAQLHASAHVSGGGDAVKLDDLAAPDDNTDLDASTLKHGLMQKYPGGTTTFLRADGSFAAPTASASDPSYSPGSFTVSTETGRYIPNHLKLTSTQRATLQGTGRLVLTN